MLLVASLVICSADANIWRAKSANNMQADSSDNVQENSELYARLNLTLREVLSENKIHLSNAEEVKEVTEKIKSQ